MDMRKLVKEMSSPSKTPMKDEINELEDELISNDRSFSANSTQSTVNPFDNCDSPSRMEPLEQEEEQLEFEEESDEESGYHGEEVDDKYEFDCPQFRDLNKRSPSSEMADTWFSEKNGFGFEKCSLQSEFGDGDFNSGHDFEQDFEAVEASFHVPIDVSETEQPVQLQVDALDGQPVGLVPVSPSWRDLLNQDSNPSPTSLSFAGFGNGGLSDDHQDLDAGACTEDCMQFSGEIAYPGGEANPPPQPSHSASRAPRLVEVSLSHQKPTLQLSSPMSSVQTVQTAESPSLSFAAPNETTRDTKVTKDAGKHQQTFNPARIDLDNQQRSEIAGQIRANLPTASSPPQVVAREIAADPKEAIKCLINLEEKNRTHQKVKPGTVESSAALPLPPQKPEHQASSTPYVITSLSEMGIGKYGRARRKTIIVTSNAKSFATQTPLGAANNSKTNKPNRQAPALLEKRPIVVGSSASKFRKLIKGAKMSGRTPVKPPSAPPSRTTPIKPALKTPANTPAKNSLAEEKRRANRVTSHSSRSVLGETSDNASQATTTVTTETVRNSKKVKENTRPKTGNETLTKKMW
eukprot:CAMPEP_0175145550 /NCGR_PEP_ID=MMETSP0087-20121206/14842_1 /TAXON_ID=136419 /ORGANISM="Unknown Unknown, Strain D1" /LENGTH=576 /DNA_ID=CAMNT_0016430327 /DNA_START=194 /DNA_END=1921 /DNA_ORIENTATION=+